MEYARDRGYHWRLTQILQALTPAVTQFGEAPTVTAFKWWLDRGPALGETPRGMTLASFASRIGYWVFMSTPHTVGL